IEKHREFLLKSADGPNFRKTREKIREELAEMVKDRLIQEVLDTLRESGEFEKAVETIMSGKADPYTACDDLVLPKLGLLKKERPS
ncbi:MAG: hypothetical protein MUO52_16080, partial [Desulfobacterales bacterium]|nr:hypothetical protein [Desulfobacterales bacterium]